MPNNTVVYKYIIYLINISFNLDSEYTTLYLHLDLLIVVNLIIYKGNKKAQSRNLGRNK